ncbi:MAG: serine/threonine protein kinase, partial [Planctomycetota bacterium]
MVGSHAVAKNKKKAKKPSGSARIRDFDLRPGRILAGKYEVIGRLGRGWEGEVYHLRELATGIERAAKLFYPHRDRGLKTSRRFAMKLHKLRHCSMLIQYHGQESISYRGCQVPILISEFVEGELLSDFLRRQPGRRLPPFQALHLLHALCVGIMEIHSAGEYHGDLHSENVIVQRVGLGFDLKLVDLLHWDEGKREARQDDVVGLIEIFYEALGGAKHYARLPRAVKRICCGKRRTLILKKFRKVHHL